MARHSLLKPLDMTVFRSSILPLLAVAALATASAAPSAAQGTDGPRGVPPSIHHWEPVEMAAAPVGKGAARRQAAGSTTLSFSTLGRQFDLALEPTEVFADGGRVIWVDDAGSVEEPPASTGRFFRGRVEGESGSWVRLRVEGGELSGIVATDGELYFLEPARRFLGAAAAGQSIAYRLSDTDPLPFGGCAAHAPERPSFARRAARGGGKAWPQTATRELADRAEIGGLAAVASKRAEIGVVADYQYYAGVSGRAGHGANSAADIAALINAVDGIYQAELGVAVQIRSTTVYTSSNDPFSDTTDYSSLLSEFSAFHNDNDNTPAQVLYGSDLAHLVTGRQLDGSVIGIAWLSGLCSSYYGTALSEAFTSDLYTMTLLVAHEMGHNFGAPHDNQSGSACSGAPGTYIMNPVLSGSLLQQFSSCSKTQIGDDVAAAACFDTYTPGPTSTPTPSFTTTRTPTLTPSRTQTPSRTPTTPPIGVPTITQPSAGQTLVVTGVTLAWTQVANVTGYDLRIVNATSGATLFSGSLLGVGATSTLVSLPSNGSYTVRVRACQNSFTDATCGAFASRNFSVDLAAPSSAPTVVAPTAGATLTSSIQTFSWTPVTAEVDLPIYYEVELTDLATDATELRVSVFDPTVSVVTRLRDGSYRLRVRACQAACGPYSTAVTFSAAVPAQPSQAPTITQTALDGMHLTVDWSAVAGAEWYQVSVIQPPPAGPGGGALTVAAREVIGLTTMLDVPVGAANVIVAACTGNGCGPFSAAAPVNPASVNPSVPNLGTPLGGSTVAGPVVLFTWNRIPGDDGSNTPYRLYVQDLSRQAPAFDVITTQNYYAAYLKSEGARYDAIVIANPGPSQIVGPAAGFVVAGASAVAPTLVAPTHNSAIAGGNIELGWTPVQDATLYEYFVAVQGAPSPTVRGVTPGLFVRVPLSAVGGQPTVYSGIVRACPAGNTCVSGSDTGWGPWSTVGPGVTNFTVLP
jgi:hypothetical protein